MAEQRVIDTGDPREFRAEIPNIIFDIGLSPFELALYCHLKRTAGANGTSWKSTETLAQETGMSEGMICKAKKELARPRKELNKKPLINITLDNSKPGRPRSLITITNVWPENFARYAKQNSYSENQNSPHEFQSSHSEFQNSPGEAKNEPSEEETLEESQSVSARAENLLALYGRTVKPVANLHHSTRRAWLTLIEVRLREDWNDIQLAKAFKGCSLDDWKERWKFNDIPHILKDRDVIERFIEFADNEGRQPPQKAANGKSNQRTQQNGMGPRASIVANRNYGKWDHG